MPGSLESADENRRLGGLHLLRRREFHRMIVLPLGRDSLGMSGDRWRPRARSFVAMHPKLFETSGKQARSDRIVGRGGVNMSIWTHEVTL